jgi:hypothetical protein
MLRELTPPSPIVGAKSCLVRSIALDDLRYFGSRRVKTLADIIGQPEQPKYESAFELFPTHFDSIPPHDRLLRNC